VSYGETALLNKKKLKNHTITPKIYQIKEIKKFLAVMKKIEK